MKQEIMTNNLLKINAVHPSWNGVCNLMPMSRFSA